MSWSVVVAAVFVLLLLWSWLSPDAVSLADRAVRTGDLGPLFANLHRVRAGARATEYHRAIKRLWYRDQREQAALVVKDLLSQDRGATIGQYWLKQLMENEPQIARKHLDAAFLDAFYDPTVAQQCGSHG